MESARFGSAALTVGALLEGGRKIKSDEVDELLRAYHG